MVVFCKTVFTMRHQSPLVVSSLKWMRFSEVTVGKYKIQTLSSSPKQQLLPAKAALSLGQKPWKWKVCAWGNLPNTLNPLSQGMSWRNKRFGTAAALKVQLLSLMTHNWRLTGTWWNRNCVTDLCLLMSTPVLLKSSDSQCLSYSGLLVDPSAQGAGALCSRAFVPLLATRDYPENRPWCSDLRSDVNTRYR